MSQATKKPVPPPGSSGRKRDATRRRIAETSLRLYEQRGYAATTLAEISSAAGISPRTLFLHFKTKEDTLKYWRAEGFLHGLPEVMAALPAQEHPIAMARAAIVRLVAQQDIGHSARVDRLLESNDALWANKQATFVEFEEVLHGCLRDAWPETDARTLRIHAMAATGVMRLAMDRWRDDGAVTPIAIYLDEEFDRLARCFGE